MIREIKFRGICDEEETTHYGKWIHGYLGYEDCINPIEVVGDKDGDIEDYGIYDELKFIKVRKETIGQYTGLKDKNGVEIWQGDIVKYTESYGCSKQEEEVMESVVEIHSTYTYPFSNVREIDDCWYSVEHSEYEVIGNIHEGEKEND